MRNTLLAAVAMFTVVSTMAAAPQQAVPQIKTRLDHLSGTHWVVIVSYIPFEVTSITCQEWTMMGMKSWKDHNNFTLPPGPAIAVLDANKFQGYCTQARSIIAHTDNGDYYGVLDRGDGNWDASTKLTFNYPQ